MNELVKQIKQSMEADNFKKAFLSVIKDDVVFKKETGFAMLAISGNAKLQGCSIESILKSIYHVATTGLTLNPVMRFAALVPRWTPAGTECSLMPMYQGLVQLVTDSGSATSIRTHVVYEGDTFAVELGDVYKIKHEPSFKTRNMSHVYAIARLHDNSTIIEVMTKEEVDYVRSFSETYKAFLAGKIKKENVIWENWYEEMARKTVLKRLIKYLPKSMQYDKIAAVLNVDEQDYPAGESKIGYLEEMISRSMLPDEMKQYYLSQISEPGLTNATVDAMILDVEKNMPADEKQILKRIQSRN